MLIQENESLRPYNSFGIEARAEHFVRIANEEDLSAALDAFPNDNKLILGGGSNLLLTQNVGGLVLKNELLGIADADETAEHVYITAGAGENWHGFVQHCIGRNLGGVENLSLIPGNTGASPMQNIGAYGVEIKDSFHKLRAYHLQEKTVVVFDNIDCEFGYRESIFKRKHKSQFMILDVTFRLDKFPALNTSYGAISQELEAMHITEPDVQSISQAVINIRQSKLPDPKLIGNAGSFFKNPEISAEAFDKLKSSFSDIVGYNLDNGNVKLAAGWLIEKCGWKGFRRGDAGCHTRQALVLVNYGHATGKDIFTLSEDILESVFEKFQVLLEREVNII